MRLIDADKLNFEKQIYSKSQFGAILDFIDKQPTAYDVEKVVAELEEYKEKFQPWGIVTVITDMTEVVRNGGKE